MAVPTLSALENTAREIVGKAKQDKTLSHLTVRIVREKLEVIHGLERGTLDAKEYKRPLKKATKDATEKAKEEYEKEEQLTLDYVGDHVPEAADDTGNTRSSEKTPKLGKKRRIETGKAYKSAEFIECSDVEDLHGSKVKAASTKKSSPKEVHKPKDQNDKFFPPLKRRKVVQIGDDSDDQGKPTSNAQEEAKESDSGMSSLFDEEPTKSKKKATISKEKISTKKPAKEQAAAKSKGKASGEVSKDEATIKRLKSFVNACGVRKPWMKVFQDSQKPSQQIRKLKEILAELGMTGRLSMEKAKKIREERELAQELEDVRSFEQSVLGRGSRSRTTPTSQPSKPKDEEEEEEDLKPIKRRVGQRKALQSITAFLIESDDDFGS